MACIANPRGHLYVVSSGGAAGTIQVKNGRATLQIQGGALTLDNDHGGLLAHIVEGSGFVRVAGHVVRFSAGQGVLVEGASARMTDEWPSQDQGLVPRAQKPPKITSLRVISGPPLRVQVRLDRPARLRMKLLRHGKAVETVNSNDRAGINRITLRAPRPGRYVLQVFAIDRSGRTAAVQRTVSLN
jgi:hypothetical protein